MTMLPYLKGETFHLNPDETIAGVTETSCGNCQCPCPPPNGGSCCSAGGCSTSVDKNQCEKCIPLGDCIQTTEGTEEACPEGFVWDFGRQACVKLNQSIPQDQCEGGLWEPNGLFDGQCGTWVPDLSCDCVDDRGYPCGCCCIDKKPNFTHKTPEDCASAGGEWHPFLPCFCEASAECNDCVLAIYDTGQVIVTVGDYGVPAISPALGGPAETEGSQTIARARALDLNVGLPFGATWKAGQPGNWALGQAFWWIESSFASNFKAKWDAGSIECTRHRSKVVYRLFYIDCIEKALVELDPSTVADGQFERESTGLLPFGCEPGVEVGTPGAGSLPASPAQPELVCPP